MPPPYPNLLHFEQSLWSQGYARIAGVDEVGRGPYAGPVVAAAVIFTPEVKIKGVNDSKLLKPEQRESLFGEIKRLCKIFEQVNIGIGAASTKEIDSLNILEASMLAMTRAIDRLSPQPDFVLIDGNRTPSGLVIPCQAVIKGDSQSQSIAAASIIAKVIRDKLMRNLGRFYPHFGFERHKGYGTLEHRTNLEKYGPTKHHRFSFEPVSQSQTDLESRQQT